MAEGTTNREAFRGPFLGRVRIELDYSEITAENVVAALADAEVGYSANYCAIDYLWRYYKGDQPILQRVKDVRPEINNKVVENHAQEIVAFKIGYQLAEPLQYTCRNDGGVSDDGTGEEGYEARLNQVNELNTLMFAEDKASADRDLFEWMCIAGVGYRMCEADSEYDVEDGGAPFEIYTLDPRCTYVAYSSNYRHRPLMGVWLGREGEAKRVVYNVFTPKRYLKVVEGQVVEDVPHTYGRVPIVEYRLNNARQGVFEPVLPLLDAINAVESNRLDGIEQTVQALMKFVNCDITEDDFIAMLKLGAVKVTSVEGAQGDVEILKNDLDQSQTQVTKEDLYQAIVNICGMPNRNGQGGSTSDTGAAVLLRDGWTLAESHAKSYELQFKRAERDFMRVALAICKQSADTDIDLRIRDIELAFNRRNYENILVKSQVLTTMLGQDKIHPELAFQSCGLFSDPEAAYTQSKQYSERKAEQAPPAAAVPAPTDPGPQAAVPDPDANNAKAE